MRIVTVSIDVSELRVRTDLSATTASNKSTTVTFENVGNVNTSETELAGRVGDDILDRRYLAETEPGTSRSVTFDTDGYRGEAVTFTADYVAEGERYTTNTTHTVKYAVPGEIRLTSVETKRTGSGILIDGDVAVAITETLNERFNRDGRDENEELSVTNFADAQESIGSFLDTLQLALLGIGSISLIVASVAILNVMLMSTIERRGEIGVLRAVGIRRGEVLRMILTEAAFLGVVGGLVGAAVSLAIGFAAFQLITGDPMGVLTWASLQYLVYGFGFAVGASVLSGIYPAWKAANDRPVEALRG